MRKTGLRKLGLLALAGTTYMMVSGGPFGIEEIIGSTGYTVALLVLLIVPLLWSVPVGLLVGELSAAIPTDGGFYVWVRRAIGPFWGFQEAWLSLASSVFDMTAYLALFVLTLGHLVPSTLAYGFLTGTAIVIISVCWNLFGAKAVGDASLLMTVLLLLPFALLIVLALAHHAAVSSAASAKPPDRDLLAAIMVAMWNYMGWDNASTIAGEVENPQRNYPRVMLLALSAIVLCYVVPVLAARHVGIPIEEWATGSWITIAHRIGGAALGTFMAVMALVSTFGIFNSLTLSLSRVPVAMAEDGLAPHILARRLKNGAPWVAIIACGLLWISALVLSFDRLVLLDIMLYGSSLMLEFVALTTLRLREPGLPRPFRMPGGTTGTILAAIGPAALLICALIKSHGDQLGRVSALAVGIAIALTGVAAYFVASSRSRA